MIYCVRVFHGVSFFYESGGYEVAQVRLAGNQEEIEQLIRSFEKHYDVSYTSKEYGRTNPKYKYSKDSRVYLELKLKSDKIEK